MRTSPSTEGSSPFAPRRAAPLAIAAIFIAWTNQASAQRAEDPDRTDPLRHVGVVSSTIAATAVAAGALVTHLDEGPTLCGISGCLVARNDSALRVGGALIGAGVGAGALGIPILLAGLDRPPAHGVRRSEPRMVVGAALTDYGMMLVGGSIGLMAADKTAWLGRFTAPAVASFLVSGIGAVVVGIPLWASGQSKTGPLSPAAREIPPPLPPGAGTGMRSAGATLTVLGAASIAVGAIGMATTDTRGDFGAFGLIPWIAVFGTGNILSSIGIPLWIVGHNRARAASAASTAEAPSLTIHAGASGLQLAGSY